MSSDPTLDRKRPLFEISVAEALCELDLEDGDLLLFVERESELERKLVKNDESIDGVSL
jgi:hypothetical protein